MTRLQSAMPARAPAAEACRFLEAYPDVQAIDIVLSDLHGVGRGKMIRRHELEGLYTAGRGMPASRHFEHRVAGVDANPYLVAAVALGAALDGIEASADPGPEGPEGAAGYPPMPVGWLDAIDQFETSATMGTLLGAPLHQMFAAVKRGEHDALAITVTEIEWQLYGTTL